MKVKKQKKPKERKLPICKVGVKNGIPLFVANYFDYGSSCTFYRISIAKGVKIYRKKTNASQALKRQSKAAIKGLAPKVFSDRIKKCFYGDPNFIKPVSGWFYVTEYAPYFCTIKAKNGKGKEFEELSLGLEKIGLGSDLHGFNMRRLKNGKLVCIDFCGYSTS
jgi:hypothetical protein